MHEGSLKMLRPWFAVLTALSILNPLQPPLVFAQSAPDTAEATTFNTQQLDALLAPIALYPDTLLTQTLMAASFPVQIVEAQRWLEDPAHKSLTGDALAKAMNAENWDPSVKATVAVPQVLAMLNSKLDWTQQVGYAFTNQQADVLKSVQRLRQQAKAANTLQSSPQQVVKTEQQTIIIEQAQPNVVYVPSYNPAVVYGAWPYPAYPPVYVPPPPGYVAGTALIGGLAFGAGLAITASLWDVGRPNWYGGNVNVNVNRYNNINVNHPAIRNGGWRAGGGAAGRPVGFNRPPAGPVGHPARPGGLPAGAIGRQNVSVSGGLVNRPNRPSGQTPPIGAGNRPGAGGGGVQHFNPANRPAAQHANIQRPAGGGAFSGVGDGRQAGQFSARGGQSRQQMQRPAGGGHFGGRRR
jgi:hypothetical protein